MVAGVIPSPSAAEARKLWPFSRSHNRTVPSPPPDTPHGGRVCCGLELDPKYVDVIIERWQKLTGKQAKLDGEGGTFHEVQLGRRQKNEEAVEEDVSGPSGGQRQEETQAAE
jgi:hypothetical protein